jgi:hypothetical protein
MIDYARYFRLSCWLWFYNIKAGLRAMFRKKVVLVCGDTNNGYGVVCADTNNGSKGVVCADTNNGSKGVVCADTNNGSKGVVCADTNNGSRSSKHNVV